MINNREFCEELFMHNKIIPAHTLTVICVVGGTHGRDLCVRKAVTQGLVLIGRRSGSDSSKEIKVLTVFRITYKAPNYLSSSF